MLRTDLSANDTTFSKTYVPRWKSDLFCLVGFSINKRSSNMPNDFILIVARLDQAKRILCLTLEMDFILRQSVKYLNF